MQQKPQLEELFRRWWESGSFTTWLTWQNAERASQPRRRLSPFRDTPTVRLVWRDDEARRQEHLARSERGHREYSRRWNELHPDPPIPEPPPGPGVNEANRAPLAEAVATDERYKELVGRVRGLYGDLARTTYRVR